MLEDHSTSFYLLSIEHPAYHGDSGNGTKEQVQPTLETAFYLKVLADNIFPFPIAYKRDQADMH